MQAIRLHTVVGEEGQVTVRGLPLSKGQPVELILLTEPEVAQTRGPLTARKLRDSALVGLWEDREDLGDSAEFARQFRRQA